MFKEKFNDIFRRKQKDRAQQQKRQQPVYFNESYFQCKLVYNPHKLSLIKVIANITVGPDAGTPMMVNCKWLIKKSSQYSEIQGVTSSCYQPCIEDVGCSILVQITPLIEGKIYSGATIVKQTGPLELGSTLETQFMEIKTKMYHNNEPVEFLMKIQAVFGKQSSYSSLDYPQDGKLIIRKQEDSNFEIQISTSEFHTYFWITKEFPTTQFIRKSYNSIVISFTEYQSMRLAFKQNTDRQILGLLLRTLTANSTIQGPTKDLEELQIKQQSKEQIQQKQINTYPSPPSNHNIQQQQNSQKKSIKMEETSLKNSKQMQKSEGELQSSQNYQQTRSQGMIAQNTLLGVKTPSKLKKAITDFQQQIFNQSAPPKQETHSSIQLQIKVGEMNTEINKIKKDYKDLMKNYNLQKQNKSKLESQLKKINQKLLEYETIKKQKQQLNKENQKLKQDNRFYRNQVTLLNKNLKKKQAQIQAIITQKQNIEKKLQKYESTQNKNKLKVSDGNFDDLLKNQTQNWRKYNDEITQQNQQLKLHIQRLENSLKTAYKKIQSLSQQKTIKQQYSKSSPLIPSPQLSSQLASKDKLIGNLQFKITNLELLLKHKGGQHGNEGMAFQKIINSLTQDITQKQIQLQQLKRVNKDLLQRIKNPSSADSI